ncbi:MAG: hypothetical protein HY314_12385 [Acidobacteria bacterium]|nr:hypothetical protein [Acidobacteriota bacterium]
MDKITQVAGARQDVLINKAKEAGHDSGLVQRASKLDGAAFTQTLVFGWMANPEATLDELSQTAASCGVMITPQGLDQRFSLSGAECVRQVLAEAVKQVLGSDPLALPVLERFRAVYLLDSSTLSLPDELKALWPGGGGSTPSGAALKLQVRVELRRGHLVIEHWIVLTSHCHSLTHSLYKAAQTIQKHALHLAVVLPRWRPLYAALRLIRQCLSSGCRKNKRRARPATFQLLHHLAEEALA